MFYYIYKITNKVNGKTYIGQHKYKDLNDDYMGSGVYLGNAKKKYGIENFEKEILYSRIRDKSTADSIERFAIKKERALGKAEYNIADGGQGGFIIPMSEERKRKISEAMKGKYPSEETKRKLSEAHKGKPSPNKGKPSWNKGLKLCPHTENWKATVSEKMSGLKWYNNGEISVRAKERPEGFTPGRLKRTSR